MSADDNARIVQPVREQLVRQKALVLAAADAVTDQEVAKHLREIAGLLQQAIYLHLDRGALNLILRYAEHEESAWRDEEARLRQKAIV